MTRSSPILVAGFVALLAQPLPAQELQWLVTIGGADSEKAWATAVDEAGNVVAAGRFDGAVDFDPGPGTLPFVAQGPYDGFVLKLDGEGQLEWAGQFGGPEREFPTAVGVAPDGSVYVAGVFQGTADFDPGPGTTNLTATGLFDPFVVKLGATGNLVWAHVFNGTGQLSVKGVAVDTDGNVILTGNMSGTTDFDPGSGTFELSGIAAFFVKLDSDGDLVWAVNLLGTSVQSFVLDGDGNLHATGNFSAGDDFDPGPGVVTLPAGCVETFVLKLDGNASFVWVKGTRGPSCAGKPLMNSESVAVDSAGNVIATGSFTDTSDFDPGSGTHSVSVITETTFVWKLDASGEFVWVRTPDALNRNSFQNPSAPMLDGCDGILVAGRFAGQVDFDPGPGVHLLSAGSGAKPFFWELTSEGDMDMAVAFEDFGETAFDELARGPGGRFAIAGGFIGPTDFDLGSGTTEATPNGSLDVFVVQYARALMLKMSGDSLQWTGSSCPKGYDVILGDLGVLLASGGDFEQAVDACLVDDGIAPNASFAVDPESGEGFWFLVREFGESYDSAGTGQIQSRDGPIAASGIACP